MNRTNLKNYAPQARRDFIQAMKDRAAFYGLTPKHFEPVVERGDVAVIAGREHPRAVAKKRKALEDRIQRHGFEQSMEALAYTWFNRLVAIRFMELHGYLDHGYRVLSHPEGKPAPEILEHAEHVEFPGLKKETVIDLKLAGNKENDLYRLLLMAQCNALHEAMPFLFERIGDETELVLPDNLLHSDSLIRKLVSEIDEEDWQEVEIIGWLYQFYISERKDEVIGKVVASEDIPAATQLFTPNWIVKYLVQNTLGRQWLATYPQSALRQQMEYYIEPAEQTPEVQKQLKAITPNSLNPEELTLLDPACGSGHILVEAYDLFKAIYQERGYRARDIPTLILQKNLFGLEIDDRAAQLAAFALMMKARADDRRIFESEAKPNIVAFQDSQGMKASEIFYALTSPLKGQEHGEPEPEAPEGHLFDPDDNLFTRANAARANRPQLPANFTQANIGALLELFEHAKTFGSLIQIPLELAAKLPEIEKRLDDVLKYGDLTQASAHVLKPLLQQARLLARQYDAVVANPPYMGSKYFNQLLKSFVAEHFADARADVFACFIDYAFKRTKKTGLIGFVTMHSWMFLSSFEEFRQSFVRSRDVVTMLHLGPRAFDSISGEIVQVAAFSAIPHGLNANGTFLRLVDGDGEAKAAIARKKSWDCATHFVRSATDFEAIPGNRLSYWISPQMLRAFTDSKLVKDVAEPKQGMATADNNRFVRFWHEVSIGKTGFGLPDRAAARSSGKKWFPYNKGGDYRRWYGNNIWVVNWEGDGRELFAFKRAAIRNPDFYFREGITWTTTGFGLFGVRYTEPGFLFDVKGSSCFCNPDAIPLLLGYFSSVLCPRLLNAFNPTSENQVGNISELPVLKSLLNGEHSDIRDVVQTAVSIAKDDWNSRETSWDFRQPELVTAKATTIDTAVTHNERLFQERFNRLREAEERNNRRFIEAYGLQDELSPEVPDDQITLYHPDRAEDIKRLLSYAIGCMMGRYSLDKPGLIYAHSGNQGFDLGQFKTFRADDDGIIPLLESDWGIRDDATNRIVEFIGVAWPKEHLDENLKFVADSLGPTKGEQPLDTIRRYLATGFYKHHLSMYKKRPIYWLFSSGKQRAFQCLVYLHRYHEGTLARMRNEYVIPLQGKIAARIEQLEGDKLKATSTSHGKKLQKEQDDLKKQQDELLTFEEKLKHAADQRISLDLDDGVKVNYGKFGDLLAESKAITGGKCDE
ncbi:BREX-1 system adenine-specific DNA-methyltransferase PglX [Tautonia marina]|uniref:BREX-1 system adenine-specific DNA-methyltransferase PglX n=1 Tax=Tautonia marina TaxID=2653855 RepID=UPI0012610BB9